jgi:hypothetical protein
MMILASAIFGDCGGCPDNFDSGAETAMVDFRIMCSGFVQCPVFWVFAERGIDDSFDPNPWWSNESYIRTISED